MSTQQVIVKAYYNDLVESQPEIRRFAVSFSFFEHVLFQLKSISYSSMYRQTIMSIKHWKQPLLN